MQPSMALPALPPVGFDAAGFREGILTAMAIGTAPDPTLRPEFVFSGTRTSTVPVDEEGIPFDLTAASVLTPGATVTDVLCAVEGLDAQGQVVDMGTVTPSGLRLTFLDAQYQLVKGFDHVMIDGDRYDYHRTQPPIGMVTETVWLVHCVAVDDR